MKKLLLVCLVCQQAYAQIEPSAGTWKTWIIASVKDYRLLPPPGKAATQQELKQLLEGQKTDSATQAQVLYWNTGAPSYRWQGIADQVGSRDRTHLLRLVKTLMDVAVYDATVAAWDSKYAYKRSRPFRVNPRVKPLIPLPDSPSYPCEHSVAAGAAATLLAKFYPAKADSIMSLARQAIRSRVAAGVAYRSDVEAGFELGRQVAQKVYPLYEMFKPPEWDGKMPNGPAVWTGKQPLEPTWGKAKTWFLVTGNQFRPGPPPDYTQEMEELKNFTPTPQSTANAFFYASRSFWPEQTDQKVFEYNLHLNPPRVARLYAVRSMALWDAFVACWDAKYTYWGIRPNQLDPSFKPVLMETPPFPGYPAGHGTSDGMHAVLLSYFFPADKQFFHKKAQEAAHSRFEGGVHFRTDNEVGLELGRKVGEYILEKVRQDGADGPSKMAKK